MDTVNTILNDIGSIQESADTALVDVSTKIVNFAEKVAVMEQHGLNVMSEDPTMQTIIDNREQIVYQFYDESKEPRSKVTKKTVLGVILGELATLPPRIIIAAVLLSGAKAAAASTGLLAPLVEPIYLAAAKSKASKITTAIEIPSLVIGGIVANKFAKKKREKNIQGEIINDIDAVLAELGKPSDEGRLANTKNLKKALKELIDSTKFAIKRDSVHGETARNIEKLTNASEKLVEGLDTIGSEGTKRAMMEFFKAADAVIKDLTGITDKEAKDTVKQIKNEVVQEMFFTAVVDGDAITESAKSSNS
jgi:hypothetical protein